ncbi:mitochondrial small ribosomal subunit Rsm22-domain-containing protein [Trametes punicea]|nr:mitochondrial small ribosomal subunit Rsm22-domain-containing protein [Trametes punicea]
MLRLGCKRILTLVFRRQTDVVRWSSSSVSSPHPNSPLDLDPAFQALLRDVEISLRNKVKGDISGTHAPRELEVFPHDPDAPADYLTSAELDAQDEGIGHRERRKSPAALFGSQRIGAVVIPHELQTTIGRMVTESDKPTLHQDAKRLFFDDSGSLPEWDSTYDVRYKSSKEAGTHALRDATAFATVALPSHYSAIYAVLDHVKQRLGPEWQVRRVIDWGAATGSGLWASGHAFQKDVLDRHPSDMTDIQISRSSLDSYVGIDKREGLVRIGKRLIRDVPLGQVDVSWQKSFHEDNVVDRADGARVLAISSFLLSSLPTSIERKALVKEMWNSGAEVMILIDHDFECVAEARERFLKLGRKELEDPWASPFALLGSHVVAPCPHDGACPLYQPGHSKLVCSFSQRLQRPEFVRKTKHSGTGHENMDYSYVVIRRGPRPAPATTKVGRVGDVGRREMLKEAEVSSPMTQLSLDRGQSESTEVVEHGDELAAAVTVAQDVGDGEGSLMTSELNAALRHEAYSWPRLVFPPLKRSGHIILDSCTAEGQIMRMTIPKSQGKQPFYDARKSDWGDLFPHEPKNKPQVRYQPLHPGHTPSQGQDIGKRKRRDRGGKASYAELSAELRQRRREERRARRLADEYAAQVAG